LIVINIPRKINNPCITLIISGIFCKELPGIWLEVSLKLASIKIFKQIVAVIKYQTLGNLFLALADFIKQTENRIPEIIKNRIG